MQTQTPNVNLFDQTDQTEVQEFMQRSQERRMRNLFHFLNDNFTCQPTELQTFEMKDTLIEEMRKEQGISDLEAIWLEEQYCIYDGLDRLEKAVADWADYV